MLFIQLTINSLTESLLRKCFGGTEERSEPPQLVSLSSHSRLESGASRYESKPPLAEKFLGNMS